ncbi:hypothetical protein ACJZ2D_003763 [Fusarium nematophilum]
MLDSENHPRSSYRPIAPAGPLRPTLSHGPAVLKQHSEEEWMNIYCHIKRLYQVDRRSLREVMVYMERQHGFKATYVIRPRLLLYALANHIMRAFRQQMYKKRFTKWGFMKSRGRTLERGLRQGGGRPDWNLTIANINMPSSHRSVAAVIMGIHDLNTAALGSVSDRNGRHSTAMYSAFVLASELFSRGQGCLAGKAIRKALVLLEDGVEDETPVVVWNLVDMMYEMVVQKQNKLLQLFIDHFARLAEQRLPGEHPLVRISREMAKHRVFDSTDFLYLLDMARKCNNEMLEKHVVSLNFSKYRRLFWESCLFRMGRCPDPNSDQFLASVWLLERRGDPERQWDSTQSSIRSILLESGCALLTDNIILQRMATQQLHDSQYDHHQLGLARISHYSRRMLAMIELHRESPVNQRELAAHTAYDSGEDGSPRAIRETWYLETLLRLTGKTEAADRMGDDAVKIVKNYLEDISEYKA